MFDSLANFLLRPFDPQPRRTRRKSFPPRRRSARPTVERLEDRLAPSASDLLHTFLNPTPEPFDGFGSAVALAGDRVLIGAPRDNTRGTDAGAAYLFDADSGGLRRTLRDLSGSAGAGDRYGHAVAVSSNFALIGAPHHSSVAPAGGRFLLYDALGLSFTSTSLAPRTLLGSAVAMSEDLSVVGRPGRDASVGRAVVFRNELPPFEEAFLPNPTPDAGDSFGAAVAVAGNLVLVGAPGDDAGATDAGAAYLFDADTGSLRQTFLNPTPANLDEFGNAVAIAGDYVLIGAHGDDTFGPNVGVAYLFDAATGRLLRTIANPLPDSRDFFGGALALSADWALVGARGKDIGAANAGAAYLFDVPTGRLLRTFDNPTPAVNETFGSAVALSGNRVLIGAPGEVTGGTGAGAAYLFDLSVCTVINTRNDGPGSLRAAINCANAAPVPVTIRFRIPTTDPGFVDVDSSLPGGDPGRDAFVITLFAQLPALNNVYGHAITLDARTQTSFTGSTNPFGPEVVLDGGGLGDLIPPIATGLRLFSDDNRVFGLNFQRFAEAGIRISGSRNWVAGNYIGTDATGRLARGNGAGVVVFGGASSNRIGTNGDGVNDEAERNVISANARHGVVLLDEGTNFNVVAGNYIGTDATGRSDLGNLHGVSMQFGARFNRIGTDGDGRADAAERNVIAASRSHALFIEHRGTDGNVVAGNFIGTDATGAAPLDNLTGVLIFAGARANRIGTDGDGRGDEAERNVISASRSSGVRIFGAGTEANVVAGNYIGTDVSGTVALSNREHGVFIHGSAKTNIIGTNADSRGDAAERNLISGNLRDGVRIEGNGTERNVVAGNYIGADVNGTAALGNGRLGVYVFNAPRNLIGGTTAAARNVISANTDDGVQIEGLLATANAVQGNYVGTDVTGTVALPNRESGVTVVEAIGNLIGGSIAGAGNLISGNAFSGVALTRTGSTQNRVQGNRIGTDVTGRVALPNRSVGVAIQEGAHNNNIGTDSGRAGEGNLISGNGTEGVRITGTGTDGNVVAGNFIGTDADGMAAVPNGSVGVHVDSGASGNWIGTNGDGRDDDIEGNVISGNRDNGVHISGVETNDNVVAGNIIGLGRDGNTPVPNGDNGVNVSFRAARRNRIGTNGDGKGDAAERNVIAANLGDGVHVHGAVDTVVAGNYIGTDVTGMLARGNRRDGAVIDEGARGTRLGTNGDGGADALERNLIAANGINGVFLADVSTTGNVVAGNWIGLKSDGAGFLPNQVHGVYVFGGASGNRIGTDGFDPKTDAIEGNRIAGNEGDGVRVVGVDTVKNSIRGNAIHSNGLLGIDLGGDGVTRNDGDDSDTGPNELQNHPRLGAAHSESAGTRVQGTLKTRPGVARYVLDFYASREADPSGSGEGQRWLGAVEVLTDEDGVASFDRLLGELTVPGEFVTATATDAAGNTSEFSPARPIVGRGGRG